MFSRICVFTVSASIVSDAWAVSSSETAEIVCTESEIAWLELRRSVVMLVSSSQHSKSNR